MDPGWRLSVEGAVERPLSLSLEELQALPQHEVSLPIACVEGWSATAAWVGVPMKTLLRMAGASQEAAVSAESLQERGLYRRSEVNHLHAADPDTLVALGVNGEPLHLEHGFPARLIGPNRPGVMQTKWLSRLVVE
jgi:DMSO/TMAO reductase YedYZ molybdopterin-dependent catalytic subunit